MLAMCIACEEKCGRVNFKNRLKRYLGENGFHNHESRYFDTQEQEHLSPYRKKLEPLPHANRVETKRASSNSIHNPFHSSLDNVPQLVSLHF
jgi:hypothetical protein